jgi:hypothetical protein
MTFGSSLLRWLGIARGWPLNRAGDVSTEHQRRRRDRCAALLAWLCPFGFAYAFVTPMLHAKEGAKAAAVKTSDESDDANAAATSSKTKKDDGKEDTSNFYLDLSTSLSKSPGNTILIGARDIAALTSGKSRSFSFDAPVTYEFNEHYSFFVGLGGTTTKAQGTPWTHLTVDTVSAGFSADIFYKDNWPTVTLNGSISEPWQTGFRALSTTTYQSGLDFDYGLDEDSTKGLVAGVTVNRIEVGGLPRAFIRPAWLTYGGAYYQWSNNWKLTAKGGAIIFGGAGLGPLHVKASVQPAARLDLERVDDSGNTLFGLSFQVSGSPKPAFVLTLSTPIYAVRH